MSLVRSGYYRFENNINTILGVLSAFSENNISFINDEFGGYEQVGCANSWDGSNWLLEFGAYNVYNNGWLNANFKKVFVPQNYEVENECGALMNGAWVEYNFTLTYNTNGGNVIESVNEIMYIPLLPIPVKSGYIFDGWYYDDGTFLLPVDYGDEFDDDITIYAKWRNTYTVTFVANGGTTPSPLTDINVITTLPNSVRSGYQFLGWFYDDSTFELRVKIGDTITNDINVYANWQKLYTLSFNTMGGTSISPMNDVYMISYNLPIPVRTGYTFIGWYYESTYVTSVEIGDLLNNNITIYAKWVEEDKIAFTLFNSIAENRKVDKIHELSNSKVLYGYLRKATSVTRPIIEVELDSFPKYNYAYITMFDRYYYITDIIVLRTNLYQINLKVDVLMSFKNQIYSKDVIVERQEFRHNNYLIDEKVPCENKPIIEVEDITTSDYIKSTTAYDDVYILELANDK